MSWLELASYWHEIQTPGGIGTSTNGQVLFNSSGSVAGDAGLTYDAGTDTLTSGVLVVGAGSYAAPSIRPSGISIGFVFDGYPSIKIASYSTPYYGFDGDAFSLLNSVQLRFSSTSGSPDSGLRRVSAGLVGATKGGANDGAFQAQGFKAITGSRPTADAASAGMIWYVAGGTGVADTLEVCVKSGADTYSWVSLF